MIDLIADYEGGPNRQDKNALTDRFCELCFSGAAELGSDELGHVFGILYALIGDVEQHIRGKLATFLAARDDVPHDLILMLANDEIEVSYEILAKSQLLKDSDLIEIIVSRAQPHHLAITKRPAVSPKVSRTLVETANSAVIDSLLQNDGAEIDDDLMQSLVASCRNVAGYRTALASRHDLPAALATQMYCWVSDALREYIAGRFELEPAILADAITSALNQAMQEGIEGGPAYAAMTETDGAALKKDSALLLKYLQSGVIFRFEQQFGKLASLPPSAVTRALYHNGGEGLGIACKGIGLDNAMFSEIYWQLHGGQSYAKFRSSHRFQALMTYFDRIDPDGAQHVLRVWREAPPEA